ncbi:MAG: hypothetical protein H7832_12140 [Magnetococcus sp. DMHC-6]
MYLLPERKKKVSNRGPVRHVERFFPFQKATCTSCQPERPPLATSRGTFAFSGKGGIIGLSPGIWLWGWNWPGGFLFGLSCLVDGTEWLA